MVDCASRALAEVTRRYQPTPRERVRSILAQERRRWITSVGGERSSVTPGEMVRNGPGNLDVKLIMTRLYGVVVERTIVDMVNVAEHETNRYELDTFEDGALIQQLRDDETERRRIEAHQAAVVDELNHRRAYRRDGHASIAGLVRVCTNRPTSEVTKLVQTGRLMREEPVFASALATGSLGVAQAHMLGKARAHARCGKDLHTDLAGLIDDAIRTPFKEFKTTLGDWVTLADTDGANQKAAACHERRDAMFHLLGDEFFGTVQGGTLDGVAMTEIFDQYVQAEFDKDWTWTIEHYGTDATPSKMPRTIQQRRFDALAAIFETSVSTPAGAQPPEPVVNIITDPDTFAETIAKYFGIDHVPQPGSIAKRFCHTTTGVPVAPTEMLAAVLAGHIRRVVLDSASVAIDMGRTRRFWGLRPGGC